MARAKSAKASVLGAGAESAAGTGAGPASDVPTKPAPAGPAVDGAAPTSAEPGGPLFDGIAPADREAMLACLGATVRTFDKGEAVLRRGGDVRSMGYVMEGRLIMERTDALGNRELLGSASVGDTFAEAYAACGAPCGVDVVAQEPSTVTFIDIARVLGTCSNACAFHARLIRNLFGAIARRNIALTRKIADVTPRTIRGRLTSYLGSAAETAGPDGRFTIPFTQQQLADYLCVDRSALSHELARMRAEGLVGYSGRRFWLMPHGK